MQKNVNMVNSDNIHCCCHKNLINKDDKDWRVISLVNSRIKARTTISFSLANCRIKNKELNRLDLDKQEVTEPLPFLFPIF